MKKYLIYIFPIILFFTSLITAEDWKKVVNLKGYWKFCIGDEPAWKESNFNDKNWEDVKVPAYWEDEGFYSYDGYAWYRKRFMISDEFTKSTLYLDMGYIDDVDEVYLNGKLIGKTGLFPPNYVTAYFAQRKYPIPGGTLKSGNNIIAVRVYDNEYGGGINNGDIGIYAPKTVPLLASFEGMWKFKTGDDFKWKEQGFNDNEWSEIVVPSFWESQGFNGYDGYAWYRKNVYIGTLKEKTVVLVLGKIDDYDQVYVNGKLVGTTGIFPPDKNNLNDSYVKVRGYFVQSSIFNQNGNNLIAVRVYDGYNDGGIYYGPIGITTKENFTKYLRSGENKKRSWWDIIFNN